MANTTNIHVTATDNELYIIASTPRGSSELCHIKSGFGNPVNYSFNPGSILPPGAYELCLVGLNWGGPWAFSVTLNATAASSTPVTLSGTGPGDICAVFTKSVAITTA